METFRTLAQQFSSTTKRTYCVVVRPASISTLGVDHLDERLQSATDVVRVVMQLLHSTVQTTGVALGRQNTSSVQPPSKYGRR